MHRQSNEKKKRKIIAVVLIMLMIFTVTMPTSAMSGMEETTEQTEIQQQEVAESDTEEIGSSEVQDTPQNISELETGDETEEISVENPEDNEEEQFVSEAENEDQDATTADETSDVTSSDEPAEQSADMNVNEIQAYAAMESVTFDKNFKSSVLPTTPGSGANEWQIIRGGYKGGYTTGQDVNDSFDANANVSYSDDNAVRMTKNVISTDTENEFQMYLNVEPQVSWEEILQLNTIVVSHNNRPLSPPEWPAGGGKSATFSPVQTGDYKTPINFVYYANSNGKKIILAKIVMYATSNSVPNGGIGIGNPLLSGSGSFYTQNNFDLNKGTATAEIDISTLYNRYEFSTKKVQINNVQDQASDLMKVYDGSFNYDGGSCSLSGNVINWNMPTNALGLLPYEQGSDGKITPVGVKRTLPNGKVTYYRQEAYQLSYKFSLDVQNENFTSATSKNSANNISAEYAVQTNKSPDDTTNKEKGGKVTYTTNGNTRTGDFKSPYIKGLLYDLEFQKVIEGSGIPLNGVTFSITRNAGGNTYSEQITLKKEELTGNDGWVKFHNLPWGTYTIREISLNGADEFQMNYIKESTLPAEIETVQIGEIINPGALSADHGTGHEKDLTPDTKNRLYVYKIVKNTPNTAKITIKKVVNEYDRLSDELKNQGYSVKTTSVGEKDIYLKPESSDTALKKLTDKEKTLKHEETETYNLIVPKEGGKISLKEILPDELKNKIRFGSAEVTQNAGSTAGGEVTTEEQGCKVTVLPGNDLTITITNEPVFEGTIKIQKVIDNYDNYQSKLAGDAFIIGAKSVNGTLVDTEVVLKHQETSGTIKIDQTTALTISEVIPKEYSMTQITLSGGGSLNGNQVTVNPGENVVVTVHNTYSGKPFFHVSDAIKNIFKWK